MDTRVLIQSASKHYAAFPHSFDPVMLHIKFDQDWPAGFRDIQVWKCGWRRTTKDGRRTMVYYKLTLWDFGSGELIINAAHWLILCMQIIDVMNQKEQNLTIGG